MTAAVAYEPLEDELRELSGLSTSNRYYDPGTDQFLSVDPLVNAMKQAYILAGDDPLNASDPNGLHTYCTIEQQCEAVGQQDQTAVENEQSNSAEESSTSTVGVDAQSQTLAPQSGDDWRFGFDGGRGV